MQQPILQKFKYVVKELAEELLLLEVGERVNSVSFYQEKFQVARGTIQNALAFLKDNGAIVLSGKGRNGTFVQKIDYTKLQSFCMSDTLLGILPLSSSLTSQGLVTGLYETLNKFNCNLVYTRGARLRIQMVLEQKCDFAICSRNSAERALQNGLPIKILFDFGTDTYLSDHVLVFRDPNENEIAPFMRVAYDPNSDDQKDLIDVLTEKLDNIYLVKIKAFQTLNALHSGKIDVGIWNVDELLLQTNLHYVPIAAELTEKFSTAVLITAQDNLPVERMLRKYIDAESVLTTQRAVREGRAFADF